MVNSGFIKFDEMRIKGHHLKEIPEDQAALLCLLLCAYNEANILLRLYSLNAYEVDEPKPAKQISLSTKMFLARTLSSKLFEAVELLRGQKTWNRTKDPLVKEFKNHALDRFEELSKGGGFSIARSLRDDCTSHYSLSASKKNVPSLEDDADLTFYIHKTEGNSFALAGEHVVFHERFRTGRLPKTEGSVEDQFGVWLDWCLQALKWLKKTCAEFLFLVLPEHVVKKMKWTQMYWPDPSIFGELGKSKAPIFLHEPRN